MANKAPAEVFSNCTSIESYVDVLAVWIVGTLVPICDSAACATAVGDELALHAAEDAATIQVCFRAVVYELPPPETDPSPDEKWKPD